MDLIFFGIFNSWSAGQVLDMKNTTTQDISYLFKILADDLRKIFKMAPIKKKNETFALVKFLNILLVILVIKFSSIAPSK